MKIDDKTVERAAIAAHDITRAYCQSIDDPSQPAWEDAPEWHKESLRDGARAVLS